MINVVLNYQLIFAEEFANLGNSKNKAKQLQHFNSCYKFIFGGGLGKELTLGPYFGIIYSFFRYSS